jgi:leader peptidase (prepilin peptidase) / N-methyltransferase
MIRYQILNALMHSLVFLMGAGIGSFLNVVIYRLPRGISVNNPRRSFCPTCEKQIPWWQNIPVVSWLMLRGKCAACGSSISARYLGVEVLVGILFYAAFLQFGGPWEKIAQWGPLVLSLWIFLALLVSGTFIDIEHFILPHEITIGGAIVGWACAYWAPDLVGGVSHSQGLFISFISSMLGLGILWTIVELGKLAFGRVKHQFNEPEAWSVTQPNEEEPPVLTLQGETYPWADLFSRKSDRIIMACHRVKANEQTWDNVTAEVRMETLTVKGVASGGKDEVLNLESVTLLEGMTTSVTIPREAMGFGDVLFIAMIGAFCGWKGVLFTILAASVIGTLFALIPRLLGKSEWSAKIPFGPYLAGGAAIWVFWGTEILQWYLTRTGWSRVDY